MWMSQALLLPVSGSTLRSLSWLLLVLCFLALLAGLYALKSSAQTLSTLALHLTLNDWKTTMPNLESGRYASSVEPDLLLQMARRLERGTTNNKIFALAVLWLTISGVAAVLDAQPSRDVTLRNVHILQRYDDYNFRMEVADQQTQEWYPFNTRFCDNWKPTAQMQRGVTLTLLKYLDNDRLHCWDVSGSNYGYIMLMGENNEPVITDAKQTTGAAVSP